MTVRRCSLPEAVSRLTDASHGIPRNINNLCFNALSLCCAMNRKQVDDGMVAEVIADQQLVPEAERRRQRWLPAARGGLRGELAAIQEAEIVPFLSAGAAERRGET